MIDVSASGHYVGDCRALLREMPDACVQTCVTSPPYYWLRDYKLDGQIGLESSPDAYVRELVAVFEQVRRVLRPDGTLWLNIGDCYAGSGKGPSNSRPHRGMSEIEAAPKSWVRVPDGMKPKDLMGIPWKVAFALRDAGWWLRNEIIWWKPDAFPSSCVDRFATVHEHVFLLSKSSNYYFDKEAASEAATSTRPSGNGFDRPEQLSREGRGTKKRWVNTTGRRRGRSVWPIAKQPRKDEHKAKMPPDLAERCVLVGSRPGDVVIDPFSGSGTTLAAAEKHGRKWIGFDLGYERLQKERTAQRSLVLGGSKP